MVATGVGGLFDPKKLAAELQRLESGVVHRPKPQVVPDAMPPGFPGDGAAAVGSEFSMPQR